MRVAAGDSLATFPPGSGSPLTNFDGNGFTEGSYEIGLTGVSTATEVSSIEPIPEPSSILGLLVFGAFGAVAMLNRKRAKCQH